MPRRIKTALMLAVLSATAVMAQPDSAKITDRLDSMAN